MWTNTMNRSVKIAVVCFVRLVQAEYLYRGSAFTQRNRHLRCRFDCTSKCRIQSVYALKDSHVDLAVYACTTHLMLARFTLVAKHLIH